MFVQLAKNKSMTGQEIIVGEWFLHIHVTFDIDRDTDAGLTRST